MLQEVIPGKVGKMEPCSLEFMMKSNFQWCGKIEFKTEFLELTEEDRPTLFQCWGQDVDQWLLASCKVNRISPEETPSSPLWEVEAIAKPWTAFSSAYTAGTKIAHKALLPPPCELCGKEHWSRILCFSHPHSIGQPQLLQCHLGIWRTAHLRLHIIPILHQVLSSSKVRGF